MSFRRHAPAAARHTALLVTSLALVACASVGAPPGGPPDQDPPRVVSASPDSGAVSVTRSSIELRFGEVIAERQGAGGIGSMVVLSPSVGTPRVSWRRDRIVIEPRGGLRPNTTYSVTLLPGLRDLRGNVATEPRTITFSTGPSIDRLGAIGRVWDWAGQRPAPGAVVQALLPLGGRDTLAYVAVADSGGQFELGPMPEGRYLFRAFIDQNRNRAQDPAEKWHQFQYDIREFRPSLEFLAIERDSVPVRIADVSVIDSLGLRIGFNGAIDPYMQFDGRMVRVVRADSTPLQVLQLLSQAADSARRLADRVARDSAAAQATPPPSGALRPSAPPPGRAVVVRLAPDTPVRPGETYVVTLAEIRNLLGVATTSSRVFQVPRPDTSAARRPAVPPPVR
jgi:hypothetical protein